MASSKNPVIGFLGGEVDGITLARVDLDIAPQTARRLENVYLITQGGMELAPGTKFVGETPGSARAWLRSWVFDQDESYCLEWTAGNLRFIFNEGYVTLTGAAATIGSFTDQSAAPSGGGDPPPSGGSGSGMMVVATPSSVSGAIVTGTVTCNVTGGSGSPSYLWITDDPDVIPTAPTSASTKFSSVVSPIGAGAYCQVTDGVTGEVVNSNTISAFVTGKPGV